MNNDQIGGWPNRAEIPDSLPAQTGHAGEFLTTDGTQASWTPIPATPPIQSKALVFQDPVTGSTGIGGVTPHRWLGGYRWDDGSIPRAHIGVMDLDTGLNCYWSDATGSNHNYNDPYIHLSDAGVITVASTTIVDPGVDVGVVTYTVGDENGEWFHPVRWFNITSDVTGENLVRVAAMRGDAAGNVVMLVEVNNTVNGTWSFWVVWLDPSSIFPVVATVPVEHETQTAGNDIYPGSMELLDPDDATGPVQVAGSYFNGTDYPRFRAIVNRYGVAVTHVGTIGTNAPSFYPLSRGRYALVTFPVLTAPVSRSEMYVYEEGKLAGQFAFQSSDSGLYDWQYMLDNPNSGGDITIIATDNNADAVTYIFDVTPATGEVSSIYRLTMVGSDTDINHVGHTADGMLWFSHSMSACDGAVMLPRDGRTYTFDAGAGGFTATWEPAALPAEITIDTTMTTEPSLSDFTIPTPVVKGGADYIYSVFTPSVVTFNTTRTPYVTDWTVG